MLDLEPHPAASSKRWMWAAAIFTLAAVIGIAVLLSMRDDRVRPVPLPAATVEAPPVPPTAPLEPRDIAEPAAAPVEPAKPAAQHDGRTERPSRRSTGEPRDTAEPSAPPSDTVPVEAVAPTPPPREVAPPSNGTITPTTPRRRREIDTNPPTAPSRPNPPDDLLLNPYR